MNIVWTDNCPTQYKCHQNFWKVVSSGKAHTSSIVHKSVQKFKFKGTCDTTGKLVKEVIRKVNCALNDALTLGITTSK